MNKTHPPYRLFNASAPPAPWGAPQEPKVQAVSTTWLGRGLIVLAIGAAFWLGWLAATKTNPGDATVNTATTAAHPPDVRLQLDAGSLTLLPDAELRLPPLPTVDPDALYRDSLDASAPAPPTVP